MPGHKFTAADKAKADAGYLKSLRTGKSSKGKKLSKKVRKFMAAGAYSRGLITLEEAKKYGYEPKPGAKKPKAKKGAKKAAKKGAKRGAKKTAKKPAKKAAKKTAKKPAKRAAKKSAKKPAKRGAKRSTKKPAKRSAKRGAKKTAKRGARRSPSAFTPKRRAKRSAARRAKKSFIDKVVGDVAKGPRPTSVKVTETYSAPRRTVRRTTRR